MVTPKPDVIKQKYAENVEEQTIHLTNVKTIPSVLIVMVITLREAGNVKLNRERKIKEVQAKEKVGRRRAFQILSGEDETPAHKSKKFPTHFSCQINPEHKKKFSPWMIQKCSTQELCDKP